jgi:ribosomal protein S25
VKRIQIVTDFLDEKRQEITSRLKELKPLVDEFNRLEAAASALAGVIGSAASDAGAAATAVVTRRRGPGRPPGSGRKKAAAAKAAPAAKAAAPKAAKPAKRRAGRRKGSGTRAAEARSFVQGQPGITIPELAAKMGIKQNYLYRVLPGLEQENKVEKKGRGWYPKG